jgi:L-2-hydroxyglutarate oxidase
MSRQYDVVVIGGGIVGTATAMALLERGVRSLVVLEAEDRLATHQSGRNSGVVHSGLYYKPGSLKARNCVEGREAMYRFCEEEGIPHRRSGKLVVATRESEIPRLDELERRGRANGLKGLKRLSGAELKEIEPEVQAITGLWVPEAGMADYAAVTAAYGRKIEQAGGEIRTGTRVLAVRQVGDELVVETTQGVFHTKYLVNCAGLQCDRVARMCGIEPGVSIVPFRGEYYNLVPERRHLVNTAIYPVPDPDLPFLGVHLHCTIDGRVECGPNAVLAWKREGYRHSEISVRDIASTFSYAGFWKMASKHWRAGVSEMRRSFIKRLFVRDLQMLVPNVRSEDLVPGKSGVRAQAVDATGKLLDDFHIVEGARSIHVLNAPSPAATSSISIGRTIADQIAKQIGVGGALLAV